MGKFCQFLTELSAHHTSIFSFPYDNLSKYQTKLDMCMILCSSSLGLQMGKLCQFLTELSAYHMIMAGIIVSHFFSLLYKKASKGVRKYS